MVSNSAAVNRERRNRGCSPLAWGNLHQVDPDRDGEALLRSAYAEHGRAMLAYATRLLGGDRMAAEDVVQEALVRVWRKREGLDDGKGSARGWVLTIVRNLVIDRARARAARPREVADSARHPPLASDPADAITDGVVVWQAMEQLSSDHRAVILELYFTRRSLSEAAAVLGVPPGTVKSRIHYALRALRKVLAEPAAEAELRPDALRVEPNSSPTAPDIDGPPAVPAADPVEPAPANRPGPVP